LNLFWFAYYKDVAPLALVLSSREIFSLGTPLAGLISAA
jgi:hypothetical protein